MEDTYSTKGDKYTLLRINEERYKFSGIYERNSNYYLFDVGEEKGKLTIVDPDFNIIESHDLSVSGSDFQNDICISFKNKVVETAIEDLSQLIIGNYLFYFDNESYSLKTDGVAPLDSCNSESPFKAIKRVEDGYEYYPSYKKDEEGEKIIFSAKEYKETTLNVFSSDSETKLFMNIGYERDNTYRYFLEYLDIAEEQISHYCFDDYSFYLGSGYEFTKYYNEIYLSSMEDCYKDRSYAFHMEDE